MGGFDAADKHDPARTSNASDLIGNLLTEPTDSLSQPPSFWATEAPTVQDDLDLRLGNLFVVQPSYDFDLNTPRTLTRSLRDGSKSTVLREEELVEQAVHLQKSLPAQPDTPGLSPE